jgi:regulator of replication initiation timing
MRLDDIDAGRIMYGDSDITVVLVERVEENVFLHTSTSKLRNKTLLENVATRVQTSRQKMSTGCSARVV